MVDRKYRDKAWLEVAQELRRLTRLEAAPTGTGVSGEEQLEQTELSKDLDGLYERREQSAIEGGDVRNLNREILDVRRQMRRGPSLHPGEFLADGRYRLIGILGYGGFATV